VARVPTPSRYTPPVTPAVIRWSLDRLNTAVLIVDEELFVCYHNVAAFRLVRPARLRTGARLPDLGTEPSLRETAARLFHEQGILDETELVREDGQTFAVDGALNRSVRQAMLRIEDVSARARRLRAEEDFVVNAAHEFLSPLTTIAGATHVLQEIDGEDADARRRFVAHIADASERLISISSALLVLARAEAGIEPPRLELIPVRPILEELRGQNRDVTVRCPDVVGVLADADLLRQALGTLIENARRHTSDGVRVSVARTDEAHVAIEIADRGSGILPEHLDRVTDRFFSAGGRDSGGHGIGLSIAARAVRALGGTLDIDSDRSGTRVRMNLPSARLL